MDASVTTALIGAASGLIAGIIGSLIAPWVSWGIEKRKLIRGSREKIIRDTRSLLSDRKLSRQDFRQTATYSHIKPHLSCHVVSCIESDEVIGVDNIALVVRTGPTRLSFRNLTLDDLARLEEKWKLI
jgi:hypothetical protein